jgi:HK97 family phage portal protein
MFDLILKTQSINNQEVKSFFPSSFSALINCNDVFNYNDNSSEFLTYYNSNSAVSTAIKLLSDNVKTIPFVVQNQKGEFDYKHPVLELLNNPNPFTSGELFESELVSYYLLTGNNYLNIIGSTKPVELYNLNPRSISIIAGTNGFPNLYQYSPNNSQGQIFKKVDTKFFANQLSELTHLKNFNPNYSNSNLCGVSELKACEIEIALHNLANIHNYSLLKNQARPSGLITYKGDSPLNDEQIEAITHTLRQSLAGASNSGKATFLSGDFNWTQLSESMKDMDFATLYRRSAESIYNTLKIPLPLVIPDNMTLANMETAKANLYDNAIVPLKKTICSFLTKSIMPRYKDGSIITFDESEIEVLKPREVTNALEISKAGILTRDEIRTSIGYDVLGGQVGQEIVGEKQNQSSTVAEPTTKSFLSSLKDKEGKALYSESFINEILK